MAEYVATIDQGTTSTRCLLVDRQGRPTRSAQREHRQLYPRPGWVEHDPEEILVRSEEVVHAVLAGTAARGDQVVAVGLTNQRETTVVWDRRTGKPVHNAIVWQDTRTESLCRALTLEFGSKWFSEKTGLPAATYFSGPKLRWLLDHQPLLRPAASRGDILFGTMDSWLLWNFTGGPEGGVHRTDPTNASRTLLMNLSTGDWDDELLAALRVPRAMLPEIRPSSSSTPFGWTTPGGPFGARIPILGVLGDQQAALVGQTCFKAGEGKNTYGTGCFLLMNTGEERVRSQAGLLSTVAYQFGDGPLVYALEGSVAVAGALIQWLRDNLGIFQSSSEVETLARTVDDSGGVYFVPAFSGLFAPHWRSDARGVIVGLTGFANRAHLARAALEATAYQTRELLDAMTADSGVGVSELRVDGGMVVNELLMQFQAEVLGVPVVRSRVQETTALGAAYAAGIGAGFWAGFDEVRHHWEEDRRWLPSADSTARTTGYGRWKQAVERSLGWGEAPP